MPSSNRAIVAWFTSITTARPHAGTIPVAEPSPRSCPPPSHTPSKEPVGDLGRGPRPRSSPSGRKASQQAATGKDASKPLLSPRYADRPGSLIGARPPSPSPSSPRSRPQSAAMERRFLLRVKAVAHLSYANNGRPKECESSDLRRTARKPRVGSLVRRPEFSGSGPRCGAGISRRSCPRWPHDA